MGLYLHLSSVNYIPGKIWCFRIQQGYQELYNGWPKSHFTLLKANKTKPNRAKLMSYISNERPDLGVFLGI